MNTQPIDFITPSDPPPLVFLPARESVFAARAERLNTLADGHTLDEWLRFVARLTRAQHALLQDFCNLPLPSPATPSAPHGYGMPPLNASAQQRPPEWHEILNRLLDSLAPHASAAGRKTIEGLRAMPADRRERLADALLSETPDPESLHELPFVAAALQILWTGWASRLDAAALSANDTPEVCPCCGSLPVASIVRVSSGVNNLRYLHCSLCNCEWNVTRATCTACHTDQAVAYQQIEGSNGAVRAECCDDCRSYLKIMIQERDIGVDPVADDLATIALDLLVDEAGYSRSGPNLLLLGGGS